MEYPNVRNIQPIIFDIHENGFNLKDNITDNFNDPKQTFKIGGNRFGKK